MEESTRPRDYMKGWISFYRGNLNFDSWSTHKFCPGWCFQYQTGQRSYQLTSPCMGPIYMWDMRSLSSHLPWQQGLYIGTYMLLPLYQGWCVTAMNILKELNQLNIFRHFNAYPVSPLKLLLRSLMKFLWIIIPWSCVAVLTGMYMWLCTTADKKCYSTNDYKLCIKYHYHCSLMASCSNASCDTHAIMYIYT